MKTQLMVTVDAEVRQELEKRAQERDTPLSRVVNKLLKTALLLPEPGSRPEPLSKRAQLVLEAVTALTEADRKLPIEDPAWMFHRYRMDQICRKVGDFPSRILPALRECERAGVLKCVQIPPVGTASEDIEAPKLDHWKLPSE